jgi:hypothetical protein
MPRGLVGVGAGGLKDQAPWTIKHSQTAVFGRGVCQSGKHACLGGNRGCASRTRVGWRAAAWSGAAVSDTGAECWAIEQRRRVNHQYRARSDVPCLEGYSYQAGTATAVCWRPIAGGRHGVVQDCKLETARCTMLDARCQTQQRTTPRIQESAVAGRRLKTGHSGSRGPSSGALIHALRNPTGWAIVPRTDQVVVVLIRRTIPRRRQRGRGY